LQGFILLVVETSISGDLIFCWEVILLRGASGKGTGTLILLLILGAVLGGILGEMISSSSMGGITPYLVKTYPIFDIPPVTVNLYVMKFVIGFALHPSIISIIGVVLAFLLFQRL
jgi:hypothetical protein